MLRKFIRERFFCGLDIGSRTVKASLIEAEEDRRLSLRGIFEYPSEGFSGTSVTDLKALSRSIGQALSGLSRKSGIKISHVYLGLGGDLLGKRVSRAEIPLLDRGSKIISHRDIARIKKQACLLGVKMDEMVIHDFSQEFCVDDVNLADNPAGLYGRKLAVSALLLNVNHTVLKNITKAVSQAGYDVADILSTSYAACETVFGEYEKRQGCVLIDMGSTVTNVLIFRGGCIKDYESIAIGAEDFTKQIVGALNVSFNAAEDIKVSYAALESGAKQEEEDILIKGDNGYSPIKRARIFSAIEPVAENISTSVRHAVERSGLKDHIDGGIFLVGGGALLSGFAERLEKDLHITVRVAEPNFAVRRTHHMAKFLPSVGLARLGFNRHSGVFQRRQSGSLFRRAMDKVKELYQEYF